MPPRRKLYDGSMPSHARIPRSHKIVRTARQVSRPVALARNIVRLERSIANRNISPSVLPATSWSGFQPDPYVDYGRFLTPEGGVLFIYKDLDLRLRHMLWRVFAWTAATGLEGWYLLHHSPLQSLWLNIACLLAVAGVNLFIVWKAVEIYRRIEIRPDCIILEGSDVFWLRLMENGLPAFQPDKEGNLVLSGIYGTRFVEYLTVRRFDEYDRMPEVFAAHLQAAMQQIWAAAIATGSVYAGSTPR
jgi:hypothetical protein